MRTALRQSGFRWPLAALVALFVAGCGGGGGGAAPAPPVPPPPPPPPPAGSVTISGQVSYDFVPFAPIGGLNYALTEARPVRLATVHFVDGATVLATTQTDDNGDYSLVVDANQAGFVRVRAETRQTAAPSWTFQVRDNTDGDAIYVLDGAVQSSGAVDSQRDLHAASGWSFPGYGGDRAAAPFAILDSIQVGADMVLAADPSRDLPPLDIFWSENNRPTLDADGNFDPANGNIGTSRYSIGRGLFLLGEEDNDTEEYDRHVILHEFGHYLTSELARDDSIGGPHSLSDQLDLRVAFSEGWATAFSALAAGDSLYRDTGGANQAGAFIYDVESWPNSSPGFFSEQSVNELVYDLVDTDLDGNDTVSYPFADVWSVMTGPLADATAVTSIYPFLNAIKSDHPADAMVLDLLAADQGIASVIDDYGNNEMNDAGTAFGDVLPIYSELTVGGPAVNVCSSDEFSSSQTGSSNKLSSRRFVRFTPPAAGTVTVTMTATDIPANQYADPDFWVHSQGLFAASTGAPTDACQNFGDAGWVESNCEEVAIVPVTALEHVLEVEEWTNTNADDDPDFPPIGRTCFDVTVTQP